MTDVKGLVIAVEAAVLLMLGATSILSGRFFGAAILVALATLAAASAWALWPASRHVPRTLAGESPRKAGSNPPPPR